MSRRSALRSLPVRPGAVSAALAALAGCGGGVSADTSVERAGPYPVGTSQQVVDDPFRARALRIQTWYPAVEEARAEAEAGFDVLQFELESGRALDFEALLDDAVEGCPRTTAHAAEDVRRAEGDFPVVLFSHCHECTRFSSFTVAERLASHGFNVVAVEHTGNTLWDYVDGTGVDLDEEFLQVRAADLRYVIDALALDDEPIGVFGHSFGSVTAGLVAQDDPRIAAAFGIAAPMENPLLEGVELAALDVPLGFMVAVEDNSITELGNTFIRDNFAAAAGPAWKLEVADAGHWSFSDLNGLTPFPAGCGQGVRQTNGDDFEYLDPELGREIAAAYVTAFFKATLELDAGAAAYLEEARFDGAVEVESK